MANEDEQARCDEIMMVPSNDIACVVDLALLSQKAAPNEVSTCAETSCPETASSNGGSDLTYQTLSDMKDCIGLAEYTSSESVACADAPPGLLPPPGLSPLGISDVEYLGLEHGSFMEELSRCVLTSPNKYTSSYKAVVSNGVCYVLPSI